MTNHSRRTAPDNRRDARTHKPLWLFIDDEPYLIENWSMSGLFVRGKIPALNLDDSLHVRIAINPISEQPASSSYITVVRIDKCGTAFSINRMTPTLFDVMTSVMRTSGLVLA